MTKIKWIHTDIPHSYRLIHGDKVRAEVFLNCDNEWSVRGYSITLTSYKNRKDAFDHAESQDSMLIASYIGYDNKLPRPRCKK